MIVKTDLFATNYYGHLDRALALHTVDSRQQAISLSRTLCVMMLQTVVSDVVLEMVRQHLSKLHSVHSGSWAP